MAGAGVVLNRAIQSYLRQLDLDQIHAFFLQFFQSFLFPAVATIACVVGSLKLLKETYRFFVPPKDHIRYRDAKKLYRSGKTTEALHKWSKIPNYGPAYLSRACHEIYVKHNIQDGRRILREAQQMQQSLGVKMKLENKKVEVMKMDAKAIESGNIIMVDLNARLLKQELLGITSV